MRFYVETKTKGRCGCAHVNVYYTDAYTTKKAIKDRFKARGYSGTVKVFREDEVCESFKATVKYEL